MRLFYVLLFLSVFAVPLRAENPIVQKIRYPAAMGAYYPEDPRELTKLVRFKLEEAQGRMRYDGRKMPKALIVPHNSLYFSGSSAAVGYASLAWARPFIRRVVLIGSAHKGNYFGMALSDARYWEMPDRRFPVDRKTADRLAAIPGISFDDTPHVTEYSLEMQLPFISALFGKDVEILPILVGDARVEQVSDLIDAVWGGPETLLIVSTDMSHSDSPERTREKDEATARRIEKKEYGAMKPSLMCAPLAVAGLLHYAAEHDMEVRTLDLRTSADVFPGAEGAVGFGAFGVYETEIDPDTRKKALEETLRTNREALLRIAAQSILSGFERGRSLRLRESRYPAELRENGAVFVSIYHNGMLRGSVGSSEPERSLLEDVAENAYAAAFQDFRFAPLTLEEMKEAEISISFLTPKMPLKFADEADLMKKIRPHRDGLVLRDRANRGLFLPSVWDTFSSPAEFLAHLKRKAALPADYVSPTLKIYRFEVIDINSGDLEDPGSIWQPKGQGT